MTSTLGRCLYHDPSPWYRSYPIPYTSPLYPRLYPRLYPYGPVPRLATKTLVYPSGNPIPWTYGLGIPLSPYPLNHPSYLQ